MGRLRTEPISSVPRPTALGQRFGPRPARSARSRAVADAKPLHVRVAEALGWTDCIDCGPDRSNWFTDDWGTERWAAIDPGIRGASGPRHPIPRYDTDWSATAPLIERLRISVRLSRMPFDSAKPWTAWVGPSDVGRGEGVSHEAPPLLAVCALILALAEAGKLPKEK